MRKGADRWRLEGIDARLIFVEIDFSHYGSFLDILKQYKLKVLFHLAWEGVANIYRDADVQTANVVFLKEVLRLVKDLGIETVVGVGSQAEYGIKHHCVKEEEELHPLTLYGREKVRSSLLMQHYCEKHKIKYIWLRLFASYGPRDNPVWLIPYVIHALLHHKTPLLTEGFQKWDYLYVEDVATAIFLSSLIGESGVFNLGSGSPIAVRQIVCMIYDYLKPGIEPPFGTLIQREDQSKYLAGDITKLLSKSIWRPAISLEEGLYRTIEFLSCERCV
jgi:nucleoside-diphosphate-sugar epimerase